MAQRLREQRPQQGCPRGGSSATPQTGWAGPVRRPRSRPRPVCRRLLLGLSLAVAAFPACADPAIEAGLDWLGGRLQTDGGFRAVRDTATAVQGTAEVLTTFRALGRDLPSDRVFRYLDDQIQRHTEDLARRITVESQRPEPDGPRLGGLLKALRDLQRADGGFGGDADHGSSPLDTAYALAALHRAGQSGTASASSAVAYLRSTQTITGAWPDSGGRPSVFVTALAAQALWLGRHRHPVGDLLDPAESWLLARREGPAWGDAAQSALALLALLPRLGEPGRLGDGLERLRGQQATDGSWGGDVYATALALRAIGLGARGIANPDLGTLQGRVLDGDTGLPLAGVEVALAGASVREALTSGDGRFRLQGLPPGDYTLALTLPDYAGVTTSTRVPTGAIVDLGRLLLVKGPEPATATLYGRVSDALSGLPLAGVQIVTDGGRTTYTAADGRYQIAGLPPGGVRVSAGLAGYRDVAASADIEAGAVFVFSPGLVPEGAPPPGRGTAVLRGLVVDSTDGQPLAGVVIEALDGEATRTFVSDTQGRFAVTDISAPLVELSFSLDGYRPGRFTLAVEAGTDRDVGEVRLRPEGADRLLPDLVAAALDASGAVTDGDTLAVGGRLSVLVENRGSAGARGFAVLAFDDTDGDGRPDPDEAVLGQAQVGGGLAPQGAQAVDLFLEGRLPFPGAPVTVWVDSARLIPELSESNNLISSQGACRVATPPGGRLDPVVKWHWAGSPVAPGFDQVMSAPVVAQLSDDNGDGAVDARDTPDVVFTTFRGGNYQGDGVLRAVSGSDGTDLWDGSLPLPRATAFFGPAVGDVDDDGLVEIVVGGPHRNGLRVFENDGSLKWDVPVAGDAQPALADLDNDGIVEIVYGRRVYRPDGTLLWGYDRDDFIPVVVDLDSDGTLEVVSNGRAYDAAGVELWDSGRRGVMGAVGNFDGDDHPEIAIRTPDSVTLLDHAGGVVWGPVPVPGGYGGALTVADVDADGEPEIGVAGATAYVVLEADGSLKWAAPTQDLSSAITGSSVFDFEADGRAEILYNDERMFRVYDGRTGTALLEIPNTSGTLVEHPLVADIDGDGHAEIVLVTNSYAFGGLTGVRALEGRADGWAPTRQLWNQHGYHITNVNDDGTIPVREEPSWLLHNTYRLNAFPDRDPLAAADLSVSMLTLIDRGTGRAPSLGVRVGNGGSVAPEGPVRLAFYQGDPEGVGEPLAEVEIRHLEAPGYRDLRLDEVVIDGDGPEDIYAVIDPGDQVAECNEANNRARIPAGGVAALGKLTLAADAATYGPDAPVRLSAAVTNTGSYPKDYRVELRIEGGDGETVSTLGSTQVSALEPGVAATLEALWDTGRYLAGDYRARALLFDAAGRTLGEAAAGFSITAGPGAAAALGLETDRPRYHTTDRIGITAVATNLTANRLLAGLRLALAVEDGDAGLADSAVLWIPELGPGARREIWHDFDLVAAAEGDYRLSARLLAPGDVVLAAAEGSFAVGEELARALSGQVVASAASVEQGQALLCTDTLHYTGARELEAQSVRRLLVRLDSGEERPVEDLREQIALESGDGPAWVRQVDTAGLAPGDYACLLQAGLGGGWTTLGAAPFRVAPPPVDVAASLALGTGSRLLVLLDGRGRGEDAGEWGIDGTDAEAAGGGAPALEGGERHRDDGSPWAETATCAGERAWLERLLDAEGWSYRVTDDTEAFARAAYGGGYGLYLLQGSRTKLDRRVQEVLVEAVYNGAGLIVAGDLDNRNQHLREALGAAPSGERPHADVLVLDSAGPLGREAIALPRNAHHRRLEPHGALGVGHYRAGEGDPSEAVAVAGLDFGDGRSLTFGFDLLAHATRGVDAQGPFARLLLAALADVEPATAAVARGAVVPVTLSLRNRGVPVDGRAGLALPAAVEVVDRVDAAEDPTGSLTWHFSLEAGASLALDAWLRLPDSAASLTLEALIQTGTAPEYADHRALTLELQPHPRPGLDEARQAMTGEAVFARPLKLLDKAADRLSAGDLDKALQHTLQGARALAETRDPRAAELRHWVGNAVAETAAALATDNRE